MSSGLALLEEPMRETRQIAAEFGLAVAGLWKSVPLASVREVAEVGRIHRLPLAASPMAGLAEIEGRLVSCIDTGSLLGRPGALTRFLVVVATAAGEIALAVEETSRNGGGDPLNLGAVLTWTGGFQPAHRVHSPRRPDRTVPLMLVRSADGILALRSERLEKVERVSVVEPLAGSGNPHDWLVSFGKRPIAGRTLGPRAPKPGTYALILRTDDGERIALLVERAMGMERCEVGHLSAVRHSDGQRSVWWQCPDRGPIRVVDPADLFGWPPAAPLSTVEAADVGGGLAVHPNHLHVEVAGAVVAVPLGSVECVEETMPHWSANRPGRPVFDARRIEGLPSEPRSSWLRLKGFDGIMGVDRILPLAASAFPWQTLDGLPPASAALFDAAGWDPDRRHWVLRLRDDAVGPSRQRPLARVLAKSRIGWAVPS